MGGILLVDEAYYLYNAANDRDYGQESIEILLNVMENNKEDLIVVLAGYKDKMDKFYSYIPARPPARCHPRGHPRDHPRGHPRGHPLGHRPACRPRAHARSSPPPCRLAASSHTRAAV